MCPVPSAAPGGRMPGPLVEPSENHRGQLSSAPYYTLLWGIARLLLLMLAPALPPLARKGNLAEEQKMILPIAPPLRGRGLGLKGPIGHTAQGTYTGGLGGSQVGIGHNSKELIGALGLKLPVG